MTDQLLQNHLDLLDIRRQQAEAMKPGLVSRAVASLLAAVTANTFYPSRPRLYDVAGEYTPSVDWASVAREDPQFAGAIIKGFEPWDDTPPGDSGCDKWFSPMATEWVDQLYDLNKLRGIYFVTHANRKSFMQDLTWYKSLDEGTPQDQLNKWLNADPHVWGCLRMGLVGFGKILHPTIDDLVQMPKRAISFWAPDDEVVWKDPTVKPWNTPSNLLADTLLGEVWGRTPRRLQKCMDWGILKPAPIIDYSAPWAISYMKAQRTTLDIFDSWCASYWFSGTSIVTTITEIFEKYATQIRDNYRPSDMFGRNTLMIQWTGDYFKVPQFKTANGGLSWIDINAWLPGIEALITYMNDPHFTGYGTPPVIDPDPDPKPETITIGTTTRPVNLRRDPSTNQTPITLLPEGTKLEVVGTEVKGSDTWRKVHYEAWCADQVGGVDYLTVQEEPKSN